MDTVEHAEMVEKQLDALIQRRTGKGDVDPDEAEEIWKESERRYNDRKQQLLRNEWCEYHQGQAARHRAVLESLIARHEEEAARRRRMKSRNRGYVGSAKTAGHAKGRMAHNWTVGKWR